MSKRKNNGSRNRSVPRGYNNKKVKADRKYKDKLFRSIFMDKKNLLSLYNALNGTYYKDEKLMEITTIENVIYIGMPNDVSVMIEGSLQLYEHQSTWNPNMPVRGLFYFCEQYGRIIKKRKLDIYSKTAIKMPTPKYYVFYNGDGYDEERYELRLSDLFEKKDNDVCMELKVTVLNINYGKNKDLMEQCRPLMEYSIFISKVKEQIEDNEGDKDDNRLIMALERAIDYCVKHDILKEYLELRRAEVIDVLLQEYGMKEHIEWYESQLEAERAKAEEERAKAEEERVKAERAMVGEEKANEDKEKALAEAKKEKLRADKAEEQLFQLQRMLQAEKENK